MTWVKLDDRFFDNPKIAAISDAAQLSFLKALCYCAGNLTDGKFPLKKAKEFASPKVIKELVPDLWEMDGALQFVVHDYLQYNPTREQVLAERAEKHAKRADAGRAGGMAKAANRDRQERLRQAEGTHTQEEWQEMVDAFGACLICGGEIVVRDHIIPLYQGGTNWITNIQPLCRSCNSRKGPEGKDHRIGRPEMLAKWLPTASKSASKPLAKSWQNDGPVPVPDPVPFIPPLLLPREEDEVSKILVDFGKVGLMSPGLPQSIEDDIEEFGLELVQKVVSRALGSGKTELPWNWCHSALIGAKANGGFDEPRNERPVYKARESTPKSAGERFAARIAAR